MSVVEPEVFENAVKQVDSNTANYLYPMWMDNYAHNLKTARNGDSFDKIYIKNPPKRVLVVGRGPSLFKHNPINLMVKRKFPGVILASDGALPELAKRRIIPEYSMTVDGSPIIKKWYNPPEVGRIGSKTSALLPITVHPSTAKACQDNGVKIYWWLPYLENGETFKGITDILQMQTHTKRNPTGISRHNGCGNCGLSAIWFAKTILRTEEIVLVGMDGGYPWDTKIEALHYHENMLKSCGYNEEQVQKMYKIYRFNCWSGIQNQQSAVDPCFELYRNIFIKLAQDITDAGTKIINCSQAGCLVTPEVKCMKFSDYLRSTKTK